MKPVFLQMQAFGPFAGKESISFSDLGESPLFLINGPTGSGKTTVLDAICYALYGSTTGNERDARDMRCQQSDPGLLTEVVFEFSLGGSSYRITRSPDQFRPKVRGEGVTPHNSCADLYKLGPDGTIDTGELLVEKKVGEANDYIRSITGLNAEQFRQVMVLPQGQFRKLLMADSKEKQKIFQSLFQTSIYSRIEDRLKEDSKDIRDAVGNLQSVMRNILDTGGAQNEQDLEEKIAAIATESGGLKGASDEAQSIWSAAEKTLHDAKKLKDDFAELEKVKTREAELEAQSAQAQLDKAQSKQAHAAEKLLPILSRVTEAENARSSTKAEIVEADLTLASAEELLKKANTEYQAEKNREAESTAATAKVHELKSYSGKAEELLKAKEALTGVKLSESAAETEKKRSGQALEEHLKGEGNIQQRIEALQKDISEAEGIDLTVHKLKETLTARNNLSTLQAGLAEAEKDLVRSQKLLSAAEAERDGVDKALKKLRQAWHQGQAAILAEELAEGLPCPVCGSAEHPRPAAESSEMVSEEQLETATTELESKTQLMISARGEVSTGEQRVTSIKSEITQSEQALGEQARQSTDEITERLSKASSQANKLSADREKLETEQKALKNHGDQEAALRKLADGSKTTLANAQKETGKAQTRFDLSEKALPEPYREVGRLEQELKTASERLDSLKKALQEAQATFQQADKARGEAQVSLKQLERNRAKNEQHVASVRSDWNQALSTSVFDTEQAVRLASMPEADLGTLDDKNSKYDDAVLEARATRETLEKQLKGKKPADLPQVEAAEQKARSERDQALEAWRSAAQNVIRLNDTKKNLVARQAEMAGLDARYKVVGTLADVACGLKGSKVSLQRYILGVLLDDVLVQSTQRLMKMSDGRYELRRKLDPGRRNRAAGLDLEVYDDYSGESRSVSTLSGGESFMAALSLALGLSDVVQAQTGGIQLDTLFVDEGFGTLDSEALELAVSTLMDLQRAGRMVGIISHVSELKEQMDIRIDLTKSNQGGSSLKVVSPMMGGV